MFTDKFTTSDLISTYYTSGTSGRATVLFEIFLLDVRIAGVFLSVEMREVSGCWTLGIAKVVKSVD
jgi:hypothetical protein